MFWLSHDDVLKDLFGLTSSQSHRGVSEAVAPAAPQASAAGEASCMCAFSCTAELLPWLKNKSGSFAFVCTCVET
jgi:hypothetical protein